MKSIYIPFLIIAISALSSGCEKRLIDYRNKYTGDYNITYKTSWSDINGNHGSSTENFEGRVYYKKGEKGKMRLDCNNQTLVFDVKKDGKVYMCINVAGEFGEDNFSFYYYPCGSTGGHGGSGTFQYCGKRK